MTFTRGSQIKRRPHGAVLLIYKSSPKISMERAKCSKSSRRLSDHIALGASVPSLREAFAQPMDSVWRQDHWVQKKHSLWPAQLDLKVKSVCDHGCLPQPAWGREFSNQKEDWTRQTSRSVQATLSHQRMTSCLVKQRRGKSYQLTRTGIDALVIARGNLTMRSQTGGARLDRVSRGKL